MIALISAYSTYIRARSPGRYHLSLSSASKLSFPLLSLTCVSSDFITLSPFCCHLLASWPLLPIEDVSIWVIISLVSTFPFIFSSFHIQADNSNNTQGSLFFDLLGFHDLYHHLLAAHSGSDILEVVSLQKTWFHKNSPEWPSPPVFLALTPSALPEDSPTKTSAVSLFNCSLCSLCLHFSTYWRDSIAQQYDISCNLMFLTSLSFLCIWLAKPQVWLNPAVYLCHTCICEAEHG